MLGSDKRLALRFAAARSLAGDAGSGFGAHAWGWDEPAPQPPSGSAGWDELAHGVSVYVDERLVGVAHGGHFNLSGLLPGMHTLQIVARDAAGNDQEVFLCACLRVGLVARCMLGCMLALSARGRRERTALTARRFPSPRAPPSLLPRTRTSQTPACFGSVT